MKKTFILLLLATLTLFVACTKEQVIPQENAREESVEILHLNGMVIKAIKRTNPYTVDNMRKAYATLISNETKSGGNEEDYFNPDIDLEANCRYIRIQADSTTNMEMLDRLGIELFAIPMDYEVIESEEEDEGGETCEEAPTVMSFYTSVPADFIFPDWLEYEVLADCYIPDDDDFDFITITRSQTESFASMLERQAYIIAGAPYDNERCNIHTKSGYAPQGCFWVETSNGNSEPLKGVKVRCHTFVKYGYTYTDANGYYSFQGTKKWVSSPEYTLIFSNTKGFNVYGNRLVFLPATYSLGTHNRSGFSTTIGTSSQAWKWAVINDASYDYYHMCSNCDILPPPNKLKIWAITWMSRSSAAMLPRLVGYHDALSIATFISASSTSPVGIVFAVFASLAQFLSPDITIGVNGYGNGQNNGYEVIYSSVWHELSHASHFMKIGNQKWESYINHVIASTITGQGPYGSASTCSSTSTGGAGICGVSESWAYAMGYHSIHPYTMSTSYTHWFDNCCNVLKNLITGHSPSLTPSQVFECLSPDVDSVEKMHIKLKNRYPQKAYTIDYLFNYY